MNEEQRRTELADFLRNRRARLEPAQVGLPKDYGRSAGDPRWAELVAALQK